MSIELGEMSNGVALTQVTTDDTRKIQHLLRTALLLC